VRQFVALWLPKMPVVDGGTMKAGVSFSCLVIAMLVGSFSQADQPKTDYAESFERDSNAVLVSLNNLKSQVLNQEVDAATSGDLAEKVRSEAKDFSVRVQQIIETYRAADSRARASTKKDITVETDIANLQGKSDRIETTLAQAFSLAVANSQLQSVFSELKATNDINVTSVGPIKGSDQNTINAWSLFDMGYAAFKAMRPSKNALFDAKTELFGFQTTGFDPGISIEKLEIVYLVGGIANRKTLIVGSAVQTIDEAKSLTSPFFNDPSLASAVKKMLLLDRPGIFEGYDSTVSQAGYIFGSDKLTIHHGLVFMFPLTLPEK